MPKFARVAAGILLGFAIGVATGVALISLFSGNTHDKSAEMAMTSVFVAGPVGAILGLFVGLFWKRRAVPGDR